MLFHAAKIRTFLMVTSSYLCRLSNMHNFSNLGQLCSWQLHNFLYRKFLYQRCECRGTICIIEFDHIVQIPAAISPQLGIDTTLLEATKAVDVFPHHLGPVTRTAPEHRSFFKSKVSLILGR